jgi:hypothetical protein
MLVPWELWIGFSCRNQYLRIFRGFPLLEINVEYCCTLKYVLGPVTGLDIHFSRRNIFVVLHVLESEPMMLV